MICDLCPRNCGIERTEYKGGYCGQGTVMKVARIAPHFDEEPVISGENGVGAVFFSGCSLRCVYCQNHEISSGGKGEYIAPKELAWELKKLERLKVHAIEFVTPGHFADSLLEALSLYRPGLPLIFNTSAYEKVETLRRFEGLIDIYLPDFKYADDELAMRLSGCPDYAETAQAAIDEMLRQTGKYRIENSLIKSGVIVRHLVLPSHISNTVKALETLKQRYSDNILVSLMSQYIPCGKADEFPDINRKLTKREYNKALDKLYELELDGFAQELSSASEAYIPDWNYN